MRSRHLLVVISTAQLAVGVTGQLVAVREGRSFEIFRWHGSPEDVARDSWFMGTGLSAPVSMLSVQAAAIAVLARRASRPAAAALAGLGLTMVVGSLLENTIRGAIRDAGADRVVTVVAGLGLGLAVGMVVVGVPTARSAGCDSAPRRHLVDRLGNAFGSQRSASQWQLIRAAHLGGRDAARGVGSVRP